MKTWYCMNYSASNYVFPTTFHFILRKVDYLWDSVAWTMWTTKFSARCPYYQLAWTILTTKFSARCLYYQLAWTILTTKFSARCLYYQLAWTILTTKFSARCLYYQLVWTICINHKIFCQMYTFNYPVRKVIQISWI